MGKKGFHRNSDKIHDDPKGLRVINGRLQCVAASSFSGAIQLSIGPSKIQNGIASKGQVLVINGAVQVVQG